MMQYCPNCRELHNDNEDFCHNCKKKKLKPVVDKNTPVKVCKAGGIDKERVRAALLDGGIPSDEIRLKNISAHAVTGNDMSDVTVLVPYQAYDKAYDICVGIGVISPKEGELPDYVKTDIEEKKETFDKDIEEFEEMSQSKRTFVRIVSAILLIILFCFVIWGTDFVLEIIKGLI